MVMNSSAKLIYSDSHLVDGYRSTSPYSCLVAWTCYLLRFPLLIFVRWNLGPSLFDSRFYGWTSFPEIKIYQNFLVQTKRHNTFVSVLLLWGTDGWFITVGRFAHVASSHKNDDNLNDDHCLESSLFSSSFILVIGIVAALPIITIKLTIFWVV